MIQIINDDFYNLGDEDYVNDMPCKIDSDQSVYFTGRYKTRDESMARVYWSGHIHLRKWVNILM